MNLKTIVDKINDGAKLLLMIPTVIFARRDDAFIENVHVVSDFEEGRPDLIAAKYYGSPQGLDIILKYNGISNPFSIQRGEELKIPVRNITLKKFNRPTQVDDDIVKKQFIDTKRLSKKDQRRVKALQKKYGQKDLLPPNVLPEGKKTYKFERGKIIFGKQAQSDPVAEKITRDVVRGRKEIPTNPSSTVNSVESINRDTRSTQ